MATKIAAILDNFEQGISTIVYDDGSKEISGPDGTTFVPASGKLEIVDRGAKDGS